MVEHFLRRSHNGGHNMQLRVRTFCRNFSSMYRMTFSAMVLPVLKFSAPTTMSRLNSYASFFSSAMRTSVSSSTAW